MPQHHETWVAQTLDELKQHGFLWENFQEYFPFGWLGIREGDYVSLVETVLDCLPNDKERILLLDLLDAQWCVYIEQLWIAHECGDDPRRFIGENHFALARLQIGSNIRVQRGLPEKNGRRAIMSLAKHETLMDRIAVIGHAGKYQLGD